MYDHNAAGIRQLTHELRDEISETDKQWELCAKTKLPRKAILGYAALAKDVYDFRRYLKTNYNNIRKLDDGYFMILFAFTRMFVKQWEARFRKIMSDLEKLTPEQRAMIPNLDPQRIIEVGAAALNIDPAVLAYFASHRDEIEIFLAAQRQTLGTLAEAKLWELVMTGDAATIRWLLPRIKSEVFGDKLAIESEKTPREIVIIEREGMM